MLYNLSIDWILILFTNKPLLIPQHSTITNFLQFTLFQTCNCLSVSPSTL